MLRPESSAQDHYSTHGGGGSANNSTGGNHGGSQLTAEEMNEEVDALELICNDVVSLSALIRCHCTLHCLLFLNLSQGFTNRTIFLQPLDR